MEDRSSMGMIDDVDAATNEPGATGGPDGPDTGLPTPTPGDGARGGAEGGPLGGPAGLGEPGGEPGSTSAPVPSGLADGAYVAKTVIAVDGPAGSGKSSVSRAAARVLGFGYQDTGAAYRALAWHALQQRVDLDDPAAVLASWDTFDYAIGTDPDDYFVKVGGPTSPRPSAPPTSPARSPTSRSCPTSGTAWCSCSAP